MGAPSSAEAAWRALVEKELGATPFEKALVQQALDGVAIAPLYTSRPEGTWRELRPGNRARLCVRYANETAEEAVRSGADALWLRAGELDEAQLKRAPPLALVIEATGLSTAESAATLPGAVLAFDALKTTEVARIAKAFGPGRPSICVSTLAHHGAGADAADELACALSTAANALRQLDDASALWFQVAVGRETFLELCKLRALRACHARLLSAAGIASPPRALVHAVCSSRTLTQRDPWVNMLRVTTQVFAAMTGGADLITPACFDEALGPPSALGRRVARNTVLVLRDESGLDRVADPAGGSYAFETLTDALAREAWKRFQQLERDGGLEKVDVAARFAKSAAERANRVAKRKLPILGVSEFANLDEVLPRPVPATPADASGRVRRDAEPLEALRTRVEAVQPQPVLLLTLGSFAESRPRAGFAQGFFAAAGLRTREVTAPEQAPIACVCGTDERYAAEAVAKVAELKAKGCRRVLLAGKPAALEGALREAGLDGALFLGADVVATVTALLEVLS